MSEHHPFMIDRADVIAGLRSILLSWFVIIGLSCASVVIAVAVILFRGLL